MNTFIFRFSEIIQNKFCVFSRTYFFYCLFFLVGYTNSTAQTRIETYIKTDSIKLHGRFVKTENDSVFIKHKNKNGDSILQAFHSSKIISIENDKFVEPNFYTLGIVFGTPGILNLQFGYLTENFGVRTIGGFITKDVYGFGLDLTYNLSNTNNFSSNMYLRGEYSHLRFLQDPEWRYISNNDSVDISAYKGYDLQIGYDLNYYGFYFLIGVGYGSVSPFNIYAKKDIINGISFINPNKKSVNPYINYGYVYEFK